MLHRRDTLFNGTTVPHWAGGYRVHVFEHGAIVSGNLTAQTFIPTYPNLGNPDVSDKVLFGTDPTTYRTVTATSLSGIVVTPAVSVLDGTRIVDLGPDTGLTEPNYDGSQVVIYSDEPLTDVIASSTVTSSSQGEYEYWTQGYAPVVELIRTSTGTIVEIIPDIKQVPENRIYNVKEFGARGDGTTNDTQAIRNTFAAVGSTGGDIYFPAGTYLVSPTEANKGTIGIGGQYRRIYGEGIGRSIIKVKNSSLAYNNLFAGDHTTATNPTTDLTGLEVFDLTIDHNISNNNFAVDPITNNNRQRSIAVFVGTDINIHNIEIINASSVQNIVVNGTTCDRVRVTHCDFRTIGGANVVHDSSVIYVHLATGGNGQVQHNTLRGAAINANGARTAIELHGSEIICSNNVIMDFAVGINGTGINEEDTRGLIISENTIRGVSRGIDLYSDTYLTHVSGYGLDGALVHGNTIYLEQTNQWSVLSNLVAGIRVTTGQDLDIRGLVIDDNTIISPLESGIVTPNVDSIGIGWYDATNSRTLESSRIVGNTIINFPMAGIRLSCGIKNVSVSNNMLVNCGSTLDTTVTAAFRTPIFYAPPANTNLSAFEINENMIVDNNATTRITHCIFEASAVVSGNDIKIYDNAYSITGASSGVFTRHITLGSTSSSPLIQERISGFAGSTGAATAASESFVIDPATNELFMINNAKTAWRRTRSKGRVVNRIATDHVSGDWAMTGWGTGSSWTVATNSNDQRGQITITAGTTPSANPTATLTFKDGAWTFAPFALTQFNGGTAASGVIKWTSSTTQLALLHSGLPIAGNTHIISYQVLG